MSSGWTCLAHDPFHARELVHSRYHVTRAVENRLLAMESVPTLVYDRTTMELRGRAHTYVWYDFQPLPGGRTGLERTVVIDLLSPFHKALADVVAFATGTRHVWGRQLRDELEGCRRLMEAEAAARPGTVEKAAREPGGEPAAPPPRPPLWKPRDVRVYRNGP